MIADPGPQASALSLPLEAWIEREAYALGFDLVGFVRLGPAETAGHFDDWLAHGREGDMHYLSRDPALRHDTRRPLPGAISAIVVGTDYGGRESSGPIARYARGDDYHDVMRSRLRQLHVGLSERVGTEVAGRPYVDTAPILERDLARRAGLGWFGKNTNLINPERGSFFFIGSLFVALALEPSTPFDAERCGRCTRCLDACPTGAFVGPHVLDARRCVSYLTIEHRAAIPDALQAGIGELLYGCDVCQDVCPWNVKFSRPLATPEFASRPFTVAETDARSLARTILAMDATEYARAFKGSAIKRAKLWMLQRNAAVVLGNVGDARDVAALESILGHEHVVVRGQASQAIAAIARRTAAGSPDASSEEVRTG